MPSWKKIPSLVKREYKIYLLDKLTLGPSPSPYMSHHPDKRWIWNHLEWTVQTKLRVVRIWWSCLLPAPKVMRSSCSPRVSTKATSSGCCWRGGTCGRDIFISSSFPSLSLQNKLELVGKMVHDEKRIPWLALCVTTGYMEPCHCGGTAASALASQLPVTFPDKNSKPSCLIFSSWKAALNHISIM